VVVNAGVFHPQRSDMEEEDHTNMRIFLNDFKRGLFAMKNLKLNRKWVVCTVLFHLACFASLMPAWAQEEKAAEPNTGLTATVSTDLLSQYIFRGVAMTSNGAVLQPALTLGYQGIALNIWGNADMSTAEGKQKWTETDITLSYTREVIKNFSLTGGVTQYFLLTSPRDAMEVFGGGSYAFPWFTVAFTTYKEFTYYPGWWFQLDFSKSVPLPYYGMSLELAATFGYLILDNNNNALNQTFSDFEGGQVLAGLKIPLGKYLTVTPKVGLAFPLTDAGSHYIAASSVDAQDTHVFGGVNLTASF
jgi:uncharacterized protein (TIGR02001 family)